MKNLVGLRFCPTDEEIVDHYLRPKNLGDTSSYINGVINTLDIYSFDPWHLPSQAKFELKDQVWHFFCRKRDVGQSRQTKSGFWKITGKPKKIMRKSCGRSNPEKIGEKKILVFYLRNKFGGFDTDWVMHEYQSVSWSPNQMTPYTVCKVQRKCEASDNSSSDSEFNHGYSSNTHMSSSEELTSSYEISSSDQLHYQDLQFEDPIHMALHNLQSHSWQSLNDICNNNSAHNF